MDEDSKKLLEEAVKLSRENHDMLKKMRSSQKNARMMKGLYLVVVIALTYMGYTYIKPYLEQARSMYESTQSQIQGFKSFGDKLKP